MEPTKSYAEALKSKPSTSGYHPFVRKPQQPPYPESAQIIISKDKSEWTDVSSISSCSWPDSILEGLHSPLTTMSTTDSSDHLEILADSSANVPARQTILSAVENHNSEDDFSMNDDSPREDIIERRG